MMSLIKRSYKYRMYPNKTQEELLAKTFGCVRVVWNACVDSFNSYDKETNPNPKFPTKSDLVIEKPWLNEVSAATLQQKQRDFIEFSRQYFNKNRKEKLGKPNYKNKHDNQSFRLPFPKFKITNNKIRIEKIGWVKIVIDRGVPDNARFISCTVSKNRAGQYFVSVLVETGQCYKQKTSKTVGVDLGIKTLATLSDGIAVENPHFLCYGGYTYVKVKNRETYVTIDWKLLRAIEKGEVEIDNEKYHLSGIEYVAKRYQDMFYAGRDIYYFKGMGERGITNLLRNAIDDLLDTISSRETYRSAEHRVYAQMNKLTEAGAMISLAIELLTSNIRHSYGEINFERYPRPVEVEGEDKH